jgi:photosystem II stability/assembly factor-like uncharacterized protein
VAGRTGNRTGLTTLMAALALAVPVASGPSLATGDALHVWAGGAGGLYASADGGRTWRRRGGAPTDALAAWGPRLAWYSSQGVLYRTKDGGVHWAHLSVPHALSLSFLDAVDGFALDRDGIVLRTTNGGRSWRVVHTPGGVVQSECFATTSLGWVARGGSVWRTRDAGRTWMRAQLRPERGAVSVPQLGCRHADAWVIFHEGAAAGTEGYHVFASLHGGGWRLVFATFGARRPRISNYASALSVVGSGVAAFVGSCAPCGEGTVTFVTTQNGGRTFRRFTVGGASPGAIAYADVSHCYAVTREVRGARRGVVYATVDGGRTWKRVFASRRLR